VGRRAIWANPIGAAHDRVILSFHGGSFIGGSIDCHRKMAAHIAKAAGCRTLLASYEMMAGRAPEADNAIADIARWLRPKLGL
jgi:acetyl esterase/lipase